VKTGKVFDHKGLSIKVLIPLNLEVEPLAATLQSWQEAGLRSREKIRQISPTAGMFFSPSDSLPARGRTSLPLDTTTLDSTRRWTFSINPEADSGGFRRDDSGGIQRSEHGSGIPVDDSEQGASRRFWDPPPTLPVLDRVQAESERVGEPGLGHAKSVSDRFHVNLLGHMRLESFLSPSKESLNIVQAVHHLLELRFHAQFTCTPLDTIGQVKCVPLDTKGLARGHAADSLVIACGLHHYGCRQER